MQLDTARIEEHRHKLKMKRKVEEKDREVEWWLTKNGIPEKSKNDIKLQIIRKVELELEEKRDAGIDRILFILPRHLHSYIKSCMPFTKLKQVPVLQNKDEEVVQAICDHLKPMTYPDETVIFREGEPIDKMLLIVDGTVPTEKRGSDDLQGSERELCGENLLDWPSLISFPDKPPLATKSAKAVGDVEALVLTSIDMQSIGFRFSYQFGKYDKVKKQLDNNLAKASYDQFKEQLANYKSSYASEGELANDYKLFTAEELMKTTYNYHASQLVGEGHSGRVYKGNLTNGSMLVIKKTPKFSSPDQSEQYVREVITYSHICHRHMVRFLGYCVETEQPLMVFEFVNNGTLYEHIHGMMRNSLLPLMLRLKIAAGIAAALEYMHNCANFPIINGDVQTINIHLDEKYTAKLSDCLSSPLVPEDENQLSTLVEWTLGYLDPEYLQSSTITEKSDVYSFGVVLAELLTKKRAVSFGRPEEERKLANVFTTAMERNSLSRILDGDLVEDGNVEIIEQVAVLAWRCLRLRGVERPSMREVEVELHSLLHYMEKDDSIIGSQSKADLVDGGSSGITSAEYDN